MTQGRRDHAFLALSARLRLQRKSQAAAKRWANPDRRKAKAGENDWPTGKKTRDPRMAGSKPRAMHCGPAPLRYKSRHFNDALYFAYDHHTAVRRQPERRHRCERANLSEDIHSSRYHGVRRGWLYPRLIAARREVRLRGKAGHHPPAAKVAKPAPARCRNSSTATALRVRLRRGHVAQNSRAAIRIRRLVDTSAAKARTSTYPSWEESWTSRTGFRKIVPRAVRG